MNNRKNILILCSDNYDRQPRVLRTIEALEKEFNIIIAGTSKEVNHKISFVDLSINQHLNKKSMNWHFNKSFLVKAPVSFYYKYIKQKQYNKPYYFEYLYWSDSKKADLKLLQKTKYDLIISHGIDTLPLAIKIADDKIRVIFNAHEYYPLEFEQDKNWLKTEGAKSNYIINKYLPKCSHMFCVSNLIQQKYKETIKIESTVITNAPNYIELEPQKINPTKIRLIHHGIALRERNIEEMATIINYLDDRFELNIMLTIADKIYYKELEQKFSGNNKIKLLPAVALNQLIKFLNKFDIGYYILPPINFNTKYALPNKLFEYVQARLCLVFGPSPEMKLVIENHNIGLISKDFSPESVAQKIMEMNTATISNFKANSHKYAHELSSQSNKKKINDIVKAHFLS